MNTLFTIIIVVQVLSALAIIGLVLLQHGKGADMGAAFGSGASGSLFGATGSSNFLSKSTGVAATIFFVATLALSYLGSRHDGNTGSIMDRLPAAPATPATTTAPAPSADNAKTAPQSEKTVPAAPANGSGQSNQIPK
jgi:preprotein translocase subunit SecG